MHVESKKCLFDFKEVYIQQYTTSINNQPCVYLVSQRLLEDAHSGFNKVCMHYTCQVLVGQRHFS